MQKYDYPYGTGVILCGGEGSRMREVCDAEGVPKHLLDLGNGETPVTRLARQINPHVDKIICTVRDETVKPKFDEAFANAGVEVETLIRVNAENLPDQKGDMQAVYDNMWAMSRLVTLNGDLVLDDAFIENFLSTHYNKLFASPPIRGREEGEPFTNAIINILSQGDIRRYIEGGPTLVGVAVMQLLRRNIVNIPTIANLNKPEDLAKAKAALAL